MNRFDLFIEAVSSLRTNLFRSLLTVLGITIGIFAVSTMLSLGQGLQSQLDAQFDGLTAGDITISSNVGGGLKETDLEQIKSLPYVASVNGQASEWGVAIIVEGGQKLDPTLTFLDADLSLLTNIPVISGTMIDFRSITNFDTVVVDRQFEDTYQGRFMKSSVGQKITIKNNTYKIVGVISPPGTFPYGDGTVYFPFYVGKKYFGKSGYDTVQIDLVNKERYEIAVEHLEAMLSVRYHDTQWGPALDITSYRQYAEQGEKMMYLIGVFLLTLGGTSLFVGGIGTMNMMLTMVAERTREFGIRKALGARSRDISQQILTESIILTTLGGSIGILVTVGTVSAANWFIDQTEYSTFIQLEASFSVILISVIVSVAVGVLFGWYPAKKATKLDVVEALRTE